MGSYLFQILKRPAAIAWIAVTGAASVVGFLLPSTEVETGTRVWIVVVVSLSSILLGSLLQGYRLYQRTADPVRVRNVLKGEHHNRGQLIIVLDRAPWVDFGQVLTLIDLSQEVRTPICLLRVETFTSSGYPQCVVLRTLTSEHLAPYLMDRSRRQSLHAIATVLTRYLEG